MRNKFFIYIFLALSIMTFYSKAQDAQFSQYYAAPLFLNPALAGINQMGRAGINYRSQWPAVGDATFETFSAYMDVNFDEQNSSVGFIVTTDQEGVAGLRSTELALQYAYQARVNYKWTFRPAIQASYTFRDLNFSRLTFGDQIDANGLNGNPTAEIFDASGNVNYFDIGLGGIVFSDRIWFGASMHHLREPDQSFLGDGSPLPRKLSIHGGYRIPLNTDYKRGETAKGMQRSLSPTFNYRTQGAFDQLDLGLYFTWEPVVFGLWYRGIPVKIAENSITNSESIVFMFGVTKKKLTMGYSFDYTISGLGIGSGGAHEVSLAYTFKWGDPRKPSRDVRELKCPVPYLF